jgi:hypothetical protein
MATSGYNWDNFLASIKRERETLNEKFSSWEEFIAEQIANNHIKTSKSSQELIKAWARKTWHTTHKELLANDEALISELRVGLNEHWGKRKLEDTFSYLARNFPDEWICSTYVDPAFPNKQKKIKMLKPRVNDG